MNKYLQYNVIYTSEPEGGYTVTVPTLPGCISFGENLDEARLKIQEAISLYVETLQEDNLMVPTDEKNFVNSIVLNMKEVYA